MILVILRQSCSVFQRNSTQQLWLNCSNSLTWIVRPYNGIIHFTHHHLWWGRNEVVKIYPDSSIPLYPIKSPLHHHYIPLNIYIYFLYFNHHQIHILHHHYITIIIILLMFSCRCLIHRSPAHLPGASWRWSVPPPASWRSRNETSTEQTSSWHMCRSCKINLGIVNDG